MHSTTQKGQWSFLQIYIITRRDEFSISGAFLYTIIYIIRASRYYTLLLSLLFSRYRIPPNQHSLAVSHKYTYTLTRRYFTSHHTYSGKKIPIHHYNIHYTYVYILYKIRNTMIIIKGHGDEVYYRVVIVLECPWFFFHIIIIIPPPPGQIG